MIRFSPDNLLEAVMRPLTMALPQSWVYTEIMAPDMRFMILLLICASWLLLRFRKENPGGLPTRLRVLLAVVFLSFPVWLTTGGNGRYFMAILLLVGPVLVAVWHALPVKAATRWMMMVVFAAMQLTAIQANPPWAPFDSLEWVRWKGGAYFDLNTSAVAQDHGVTYVTLPGQSNALVAPLFPADSHWINMTSFQGQDFVRNPRAVVVEAKRRLQQARDLRLLVRSQPRQANSDDGLPDEVARKVLNAHLTPFGMKLSMRAPCKLLPSMTLASMTSLVSSDTPAKVSWLKAHAGYWVCPLDWAPQAGPFIQSGQSISAKADEAVRKVESLCPRLFPPGQSVYRRTEYGYERSYAESDANMAYVEAEGGIYVKMFRALNPQYVGTVDVILRPDFRLDCGGFVGREGMSWHRRI